MKSLIPAVFVPLLAAVLAGCNTHSSNYEDVAANSSTQSFAVCSGFDCYWRTKVPVTRRDANRYAAIMAAGRSSPDAERKAVAKAVVYFEKSNAAFLGHTDTPMSQFRNAGKKGEMDCIDEGTNTQSLLRYLDRRGLLRHHSAGPTITRGFILDGQFPHVTAVLIEENGFRWSVDSWPTEVGQEPEIMSVEQWVKNGDLAEELSAAMR
ncbi:hypothetical protein [Mesorhizobium xinjiangense]|uniref:hypothetical protein n=1 Tax=Mesorhizobium xinjiangense TaxID=2678685 RepID=UPI0012EE67F9|nr:hypothetical protein [Mesorhizobium xinjiangense]